MSDDSLRVDASGVAGRSDRRQFLSTMSSLAAGSVALSTLVEGQEVAAQEPNGAQPTAAAEPLLGGPVLQNPSPTGMTVAWATDTLATGWVEYGATADLGQRAEAAANGLKSLSERFLSVRLTRLKAGEPVFYRTVTQPIDFRSAYRIEKGEPIIGATYRFTTPSESAETASFQMINDTHEKLEVLRAITTELAAKPADFTVWNGDIFDDIRSDEQIVTQVLRPAGAAYAATAPVLFTSGNHDVRGKHARALSQAMIDWPHQGSLGRSFAVRQGPLAIIGLDTGEDKPDAHPTFAGLASFEPYRKAQGEWLAQTLVRPEIQSAPHLVVFCHIPLWGLPEHNPGDTLDGYAYYSRNSQQAWHKHLEQAGVQLVLSGHMHQFRYDEPTAEHSYGQMVGGGPSLQSATIIRGEATAKELIITATGLGGEKLGSWKFAPRKRS